MQTEIQSLLEEDNPKKRKRAIQLMSKHPDDMTLHYLARLAKKDSDEFVRKLAMQLGREIQLALNPKQEKDIESKAEAERILDKALETMIEGDVGFARQIARKGFQTFPGLKYDSHYRELAADIMGMQAHDAVEHLLGKEALFRKVKINRSNSNQSGFLLPIKRYLYKEQASWLDILIDIIIYISAITLPLLILLLVGNALFTIGLAMMQSSPSTPETQELSLALAQFAGFDGISFSLVLTLLFALFVTIPFLMVFTFQMLLTHISAVWFLSGDGSFRNLIHLSLIPMISMSTFYWLLLIAPVFMYAIDLGSLVEAGLLDFIGFLGFFGFIFWFANIVGNVYRMEFSGGCMAMMFPYLVLFACSCALITINLSSALFGR